jgi:hypothetical protein
MIFNTLMCVLNLAAGFLQVHNHHLYGSLPSFAAGVFIAVMTIRFHLHWKQMDRTLAELHRRHAELLRRHNMSGTQIAEAERKAFENLKLVAKAVGATIDNPGLAFLKMGKVTFKIDVGTVSRLENGTFEASTCYQAQTSVPYPEYVASVLLLLKHDPKIFDRWCARDGYHA